METATYAIVVKITFARDGENMEDARTLKEVGKWLENHEEVEKWEGEKLTRWVMVKGEDIITLLRGEMPHSWKAFDKAKQIADRLLDMGCIER